jgi:hypothetical protein
MDALREWACEAVGVYHVQLRQFPHNMSRFNLDEGALRGILYPWVAGQPVQFGERMWSPHHASVIVLEGPELPLGDLSLGRGWRAAERGGEDVTAQVVAQVRQELAERGTVGAGAAAAPAPGGASDALAAGVALAGLLGADAARLLEAWRAVAGEAPGLSPSETLALAERRLSEVGDDR